MHLFELFELVVVMGEDELFRGGSGTGIAKVSYAEKELTGGDVLEAYFNVSNLFAVLFPAFTGGSLKDPSVWGQASFSAT